jgi:lipopolysaccharide export system protein LptC
MKKTRIVILAIVIVAAICTAFYIVNNNSKKESAKEAELTEIQKITTRNMEKDYPATPREVIKFYNRIVKCYYGRQYSDDELEQLADQALSMFDDDLLKKNEKESYIESVKSDAAQYEEDNKSISQTDVCDSNDVKYMTDNGDDIAYVTASYFIKTGSSYTKTYQEYVLRKDGDGDWKILTFYKIEGESSESDE